MEPNQNTYIPEKSQIAKDTEENIRQYIEVKNALFMNFYSPKPEHKENIKELYLLLLDYIHKLLGYGMADNLVYRDQILQLQEEIGHKQSVSGLGRDNIEELRRLTSWIDTNVLYAYFKTQKNIAPCIYHSHTTTPTTID